LIELPLSIAKRIANLFPLELLPPADIIVRVGDLRFAIPSRILWHAIRNLEHVVIDRAYTKLRTFEPRKGDRVLDVGAALGFYSVLAAKNGASVVALEPQPLLARYALRNAHLNNVSIRVLNIAISPDPLSDRVSIYVSRNPLASSVYPSHADLHGGVEGVIAARSISLDTILRSLGPFTIVKLDAECVELEVLRRSSLEGVARLVVEVHTDCVDVSELCRVLESKGFETSLFLDSEEPYQAIVYALATNLRTLPTDGGTHRR